MSQEEMKLRYHCSNVLVTFSEAKRHVTAREGKRKGAETLGPKKGRRDITAHVSAETLDAEP